MILSERRARPRPDHTGIMRARGRPRAGNAARRRAAARRRHPRRRDRPANRPDLLSVYGVAREVAALYAASWHGRRAPSPSAPATRRSTFAIEDLERLPALHRARCSRTSRSAPRRRGCKARLTRRHAADLERRRRHELRHARAREPAACLRLREARGRARSSSAARARASSCARSTASTAARRRRPRDRRRRARRSRSPGSWAARRREVGRADDERPARGRELRADRRSSAPPSGCASAPRRSNRWEKGVDPYLAGPAARARDRLIVELAGARWIGDADVQGELPERPVVRSASGARRRGARPRDAAPDQHAHPRAAGLRARRAEGDVVPTWRARDVTREVDVVEEVAPLPPRRHALHPARAARDVRHATREQRCAAGVEDVLVGAGLRRDLHAEPRRRGRRTRSALRSCPSRSGRASGAADDAASRASSRPRGTTSTPGTSGHRALRDRARLSAVRRRAARERSAWRDRRGRLLHARRASSRRSTRRSRPEPRFERAEDPLLHPGKTARVDAGVVGELRPACSRATGARSSSTSRRSSSMVARAGPTYEDVITLSGRPPGPRRSSCPSRSRPAISSRRRARLRARSCARCGSSTSTTATRSARAASRSPSRSAFQSPERTLSDEDAGKLRKRIVDALAERFGAELRASQ